VEPKCHLLSFNLFNLTKNYESLCDLGGGSGKVWGRYVPVDVSNRTVVDLYQPGLEIGLKSSVYTNAVFSDVVSFMKTQEDCSFDVVMAISVIEHLNYETGVELALQMKRVAKNIAIIYTSNGYVYQPPDVDNPYQEHITGWTCDELELLGYKFVRGFNGLKTLRTTYGSVRFKPRMIFSLLVLMSSFFTFRSKRLAFEILHVSNKQ
jgi:hypothetical protein